MYKYCLLVVAYEKQILIINDTARFDINSTYVINNDNNIINKKHSICFMLLSQKRLGKWKRGVTSHTLKKKLRNKLFSIFVCAFMKKAGINALANISQLL